jgi:hypothetical protein
MWMSMLMSNDIRRGSSRFVIAEDGKRVPISACNYTSCFLNNISRRVPGASITDHLGVADTSSTGEDVVCKCGSLSHVSAAVGTIAEK